MKKLVFSIAALFMSLHAHAGTSVDGKVKQIRIESNGIAMIIFDKPLSGVSPQCINSYYANALAINTDTSGGKSILSVALAAKAMGSNVVAYGLGVCSIYNGYVENIDYIVSN